MGCKNCLFRKKIWNCCCMCCSISCCIMGLGWSTFLIVLSGNYQMTGIWPAITLIVGILLFLVSFFGLVVSLYDLITKYSFWCQKYSMDGNLNDLNAHEQQQRSTIRHWNIFSSQRSSYSMDGQSQANSATQQSCYDLPDSSIQSDSGNNNENRSQLCCWPKSQTDHIQEDIPLQAQGRFLRWNKGTGGTSCRTTAMCSIPPQNANIEAVSNIPILQTFVQTRSEDLPTENTSPHRNQLRSDINSQEMSKICFEMQSSENTLMAASSRSSSSDDEFHIYESINSLYEEELKEPDYEDMKPLPPRRRQQNFLNNALDNHSGDAELIYESIQGDDVQATAHVYGSGEPELEVDSRRLSLNSDYESIENFK